MTTDPGPGARPGEPAELRISDTERSSALDALGEHMAAGRLNLDEYGTRSAQVVSARTARDLGLLFEDLPAPHPAVSTALARTAPSHLVAPSAPTAPAAPTAPGVQRAADRSRAQKIVGAISASSGLVAVILFFVLSSAGVDNAWLAFLLIPLISGIAGSVWGKDWRRDG